MEFILYVREGVALVEVVANFKYLCRILDQTGDDWQAIRMNIKQVRKVWGRLGELPRREGADPRVVEMFYRDLKQTVTLFGLDTWVLS